MTANVKILLTAVCVTLLASGLSGQIGNRYLQRGFAAPEYDGLYDQGKYAIGQVHLHTHPAHLQQQNNGQGYQVPAGWNGYHQAANVFNPYQKLGYVGYQHQGFNGAGHQQLQQGFGDGQNMFGAPLQQPVAAATGFVGNRRLRLM